MNQEKVDVIPSWHTPKTALDVRSFHGLGKYNRNFIRHFSFMCVPMLDTIKGGMKEKFYWAPQADHGFETLKKKIEELPTLVLLSFNKFSQVECDASNVSIKVFLSQEERLVDFHGEKLDDAKRRYSSYDL